MFKFKLALVCTPLTVIDQLLSPCNRSQLNVLYIHNLIIHTNKRLVYTYGSIQFSIFVQKSYIVSSLETSLKPGDWYLKSDSLFLLFCWMSESILCTMLSKLPEILFMKKCNQIPNFVVGHPYEKGMIIFPSLYHKHNPCCWIDSCSVLNCYNFTKYTIALFLPPVKSQITNSLMGTWIFFGSFWGSSCIFLQFGTKTYLRPLPI